MSAPVERHKWQERRAARGRADGTKRCLLSTAIVGLTDIFDSHRSATVFYYEDI